MEETQFLEYQEQIKSAIREANNILVFTGESANEEVVLSALALEKALGQLNKKVSVYSDTAAVSKLNFLEATKGIRSHLSPQSLIISLGYSKDDIEKVGYDTTGQNFNLIITPKKGRIDPSRIIFDRNELEGDLVIVLGAKALSEIGTSFKDYQNDLRNKVIVDIDNQDGNQVYGNFNLVDKDKKTFPELMYSFLDVFEIQWQNDIANLLLMGLYLKTDSFRNESVTADTFALVAQLIDRGANLSYVVKQLYHRSGPTASSSTPMNVEAASTDSSVPPTPFNLGQKPADTQKIEIDEPPVFQPGQVEF